MRNTVNFKHEFDRIKRQFFPQWDRRNLWRINTRSKRKVDGRCDAKRRVIEIVTKPTDQDEFDRLLIHEICHAVAGGGHGKVWQSRMETAAWRADKLGRRHLAELLRQEIVNYQEAAEGLEQAYHSIQDWVAHEPDLTLAQVKRLLADQFGLLISEVEKMFKRTEKSFREAKREAMKARTLKTAWMSREGR